MEFFLLMPLLPIGNLTHETDDNLFQRGVKVNIFLDCFWQLYLYSG